MNEKVTNLENGERIAYIFALPYNSSAQHSIQFESASFLPVVAKCLQICLAGKHKNALSCDLARLRLLKFSLIFYFKFALTREQITPNSC